MNSHLLMFDFDGVIVDSFDYFFDAFMQSCREHGYSRIRTREDFIRLFETNMYEGMSRAGIGSEAIGPLLGTMGEILKHRDNGYDIFPGMEQVLRRLAGDNALVVVTSNLGSVVREYVRDRHLAIFDMVLGSEDGRSKVEKMERAMARNPGRVPYYIGDTMGDIREGHQAGARTVGVGWGWHGAELLRSAAPDHIVNTPEELPVIFGRGRSHRSGNERRMLS